MDAEIVREIEPGELVVLNENGCDELQTVFGGQPAMCVFEYVYFARPDSKIFGANAVYATRKALGRQLAQESWVPADIVIPVPDSGVPAALGYAEGAGIPFETGLIRNHYVGRTFIEPEQSIRHFGVKVKLNAVPEVLHGKRVVVVDDSLVRGTTSRKIVKMIRQAGAKGSAHADQFSTDHFTMLLRDRHADQKGTHRFQSFRRGNTQVHHGGQLSLSQSRRDAEIRPWCPPSLLQRLLHRTVSHFLYAG